MEHASRTRAWSPRRFAIGLVLTLLALVTFTVTTQTASYAVGPLALTAPAAGRFLVKTLAGEAIYQAGSRLADNGCGIAQNIANVWGPAERVTVGMCLDSSRNPDDDQAPSGYYGIGDHTFTTRLDSNIAVGAVKTATYKVEVFSETQPATSSGINLDPAGVSGAQFIPTHRVTCSGECGDVRMKFYKSTQLASYQGEGGISSATVTLVRWLKDTGARAYVVHSYNGGSDCTLNNYGSCPPPPDSNFGTYDATGVAPSTVRDRKGIPYSRCAKLPDGGEVNVYGPEVTYSEAQLRGGQTAGGGVLDPEPVEFELPACPADYPIRMGWGVVQTGGASQLGVTAPSIPAAFSRCAGYDCEVRTSPDSQPDPVCYTLAAGGAVSSGPAPCAPRQDGSYCTWGPYNMAPGECDGIDAPPPSDPNDTGCTPSGWDNLNPFAWIQALPCVLKALFIPTELGASFGQLRTDLAAKPPTSVLVWAGDATAGARDGYVAAGECTNMPDFDPHQQGRLQLPCQPDHALFRLGHSLVAVFLVGMTALKLWSMAEAGLKAGAAQSADS